MASGSLPKSPVSSSLCDEVPHIFIRKTHLQPREFLISSGKGLLQHNLPTSDIDSRARSTAKDLPLFLINTRIVIGWRMIQRADRSRFMRVHAAFTLSQFNGSLFKESFPHP